MKVFVVMLALSVVLSAAPSYAQAQAPAPAPAAPAGQAQPAPAPQPRPPFQAGLKYAYVNLQEVAATSSDGKAFQAKVQALTEQKTKELQDKDKAMRANQEKLEKNASVMNDQARSQLQLEIERQQRDIQRFTEDAQQEITALTQQLQVDFQRRLAPIIDEVAKQRQVHFIFDAQDSGLVWADPTMDLTPDVIRALDGPKPAAAVPPAAAPPAASVSPQVPVKP